MTEHNCRAILECALSGFRNSVAEMDTAVITSKNQPPFFIYKRRSIVECLLGCVLDLT